MTVAERKALLGSWIKPSSDNEVSEQERALRMVRGAIDRWPALNGVGYRIYAKGSYANNTNVRRDSDVDIVVECTECQYYDFLPGVSPTPSSSGPYKGKWTPALWRSTVLAALQDAFGRADVDADGEIAFNVVEKEGSRPSIDVIPSFDYVRYDTADRSVYHRGSCVWTRSGQKVVNWPEQQLANGRAKNDNTGKRYKNYVRALKNAENFLVAQEVLAEKPSYLMECIVWNISNATLTSGDLDSGFRATLIEGWNALERRRVLERLGGAEPA